MFNLGPGELIFFGIIAILLFGKRLPSVAMQFGKSYRDFRRSLSDIQSQVDFTGDVERPVSPSPKKQRSYDYDDHDEASAPRFVPPPAAPPSDGDTPPSENA